MSNTLHSISLPDAVYRALRESIVTAGYLPGSEVTELAVSKRYSVARPTAKAAIERLVSEGLLSRSAHRAARVPILGELDILDLYASRSVVEVAALRNLAEAVIVPVGAIRAHRELTAIVASEGSTYARTDGAFHRALVECQRSPRLARMHSLIMGEIELCIGQVDFYQLMSGADVAAQHQGILDAVLAGDVDGAGDRTREHILMSRDRLLLHVKDDARLSHELARSIESSG